jgi:hypothetical protein
MPMLQCCSLIGVAVDSGPTARPIPAWGEAPGFEQQGNQSAEGATYGLIQTDVDAALSHHYLTRSPR